MWVREGGTKITMPKNFIGSSILTATREHEQQKMSLSAVVRQQAYILKNPVIRKGCSMLFCFILSMHSEKGGDIARLVHWRGLNESLGKTVWRYHALQRVEQLALPDIKNMLRADPRMAGMPCSMGAKASPLHIAAFLGMAHITALLLSHGARADAKTLGGRTPLDEAMYNGNHEVVVLLVRALPPLAQEGARRRIAKYIALPDASLRATGLRELRLPQLPKRAARVDPRPPEPPGAHRSCDEGGAWSREWQPPPAGSPLAAPGAAAAFDESMIDQRVGLSEEEYYHEYFLKGRPVLIRNAVNLAERCMLAASRAPMREAAGGQKFACGATAYPELTGRQSCGRFSFLELISSPRCADAGRTRPVCNWKLGRMRARSKYTGNDWNAAGINLAAGFKEMPMKLRHSPELPPLSMMRRAWSTATSRALWGGTAWSGSGFHYHNPCAPSSDPLSTRVYLLMCCC